MDVFAELSARQQRPAHPTMATTTRVSPTSKFAVTHVAPVPEAAPTTTTAVPTSTRSSQETLSSPSSPQRINSASIPSTGSSPTKTSSSSSSYEFPTTFTAFHPSNKPTAPLYRPAALRSADYPAPPQPFLRRNSFSFKEAASVKRDHWKVFIHSLVLIQPDIAAQECTHPSCQLKFSIFQRRHHCRKCGEIFCDPHSPHTLRLHPNTLQFTDNTSFPLVRGCPSCHGKYQEWLMRKRNRQNSVRSDCLGGERVGVLIRRGSQNEDQSGILQLIQLT
jgi:FYVE zinc finger